MGNCCSPQEQDFQKILATKDKSDLLKYYSFKETNQLGNGAFGTVFKATSKEDKNFHCAIKVLEKDEMTESDIRTLRREIATLIKLDQPNICNYYETYECPEKFYLRMEFCGGGELVEKI